MSCYYRYKRGNWLGKLTEHYNLIAVSGTHGKKILFRLKYDCYILYFYICFIEVCEKDKKGKGTLRILCFMLLLLLKNMKSLS